MGLIKLVKTIEAESLGKKQLTRRTFLKGMLSSALLLSTPQLIAGEEPLSYSFVIISDSNGRYGRPAIMGEFKTIVNTITEKIKPDFIIHAGDMIAGGPKGVSAFNGRPLTTKMIERLWPSFNEALYSFRSEKIPFFPCAGNHDKAFNTVLKELYKEQWARHANAGFNINGSYTSHYSFAYDKGKASSLFIMLDTAEGCLRKKQLGWLESELEKAHNNYNHTFVVSHVPLKHVGDSKKRELKNSKAIAEMLKKYNITKFFGAHNHVYYAQDAYGIPHITTGRAGGTGRYGLRKDEDPQQASFVLVKVSADSVNYIPVGIKGQVLHDLV